MKKIVYILTIIAIASLSSYADPVKGQKLYKHKLRKGCHFSGLKFSRAYTQSEWKEFYTKGLFPQKTKELCPKVDLEKIDEKWWKDIYEFTYEYAKDSGNVPSC